MIRASALGPAAETLRIIVEDVNDNSPEFLPITDTFGEATGVRACVCAHVLVHAWAVTTAQLLLGAQPCSWLTRTLCLGWRDPAALGSGLPEGRGVYLVPHSLGSTAVGTEPSLPSPLRAPDLG